MELILSSLLNSILTSCIVVHPSAILFPKGYPMVVSQIAIISITMIGTKKATKLTFGLVVGGLCCLELNWKGSNSSSCK